MISLKAVRLIPSLASALHIKHDVGTKDRNNRCNPCNKPTAQLDLLHSNNPTVLALLVQSLNITTVNSNGKSKSLKKQVSRPVTLYTVANCPSPRKSIFSYLDFFVFYKETKPNNCSLQSHLSSFSSMLLRDIWYLLTTCGSESTKG